MTNWRRKRSKTRRKKSGSRRSAATFWMRAEICSQRAFRWKRFARTRHWLDTSRPPSRTRSRRCCAWTRPICSSDCSRAFPWIKKAKRSQTTTSCCNEKFRKKRGGKFIRPWRIFRWRRTKAKCQKPSAPASRLFHTTCTSTRFTPSRISCAFIRTARWPRTFWGLSAQRKRPITPRHFSAATASKNPSIQN